MFRIGIVLLAVIAVSGCASRLTTFDSDGGKEMKGIPVGKPVLVKIASETIYQQVSKGTKGAILVDGKSCPKLETSEYKFLPLGEVYYVNFKPSVFGKGVFKIEFASSGNLKIVSVNSDASAGIDAVKSLLETTLPYIATVKTKEESKGIQPQAPLVETNGKPSNNKKTKIHCMKMGKTEVSIEKIEIKP